MTGAARTALARWLAAAGCFALAVIIRGLNYPQVITPDGVRPYGNDAFYHLRRIQWDLVHFPRHLEFDSYLAPPSGGRAIWTPAFDWSLAALARIAVGPEDWGSAERLLVWVPVVLGGATVVVLHALAYPRFGPGVAGLAALLLALLPAHAHYSQIGFVDHHAAVALMSALLLVASLTYLSRTGESAVRAWSVLWASAALGLALGGALLLWPGSLLHVGIVQVGLLSTLLGTRDGRRATTRARGLALAHGIALAMVLPFCLAPERKEWGSYSPVVLSYFQPWLLGAGTVCFTALAVAWRRDVPRSWVERTLHAGLIGGLCAGGSALLLAPDAYDGMRDALEWFMRKDSFQSVVHESQPLLANRVHAEQMLSRFVYLTPLMVIALAVSARRSERAAEHRLLAWWSLCLFLAALSQWRFVNSLSLIFALLVAWTWAGLHRGLASHLGAIGSPAQAALHAATLGAAALLLWPAIRSYGPWLAHYAPERFTGVLLMRRDELVELAAWLRHNSEETSGYLDTQGRPEYTVLSAWGDGHTLRYVARRAAVTDSFGNDVDAANFEAAERYFAAESEDEALAVAEPLAVRYVVVRRPGSGHAKPYSPRAMFRRLYGLTGLQGAMRARQGARPQWLAALTRHRQIYASAFQIEGRPFYRVYEIVEGARVVGETAPNALVASSLVLRGNLGARLQYSVTTRSDAEGRFELRLPYATDRAAGMFSPQGEYELGSDGIRASLAVPERSVRLGETLTAPSLRPHTFRVGPDG